MLSVRSARATCARSSHRVRVFRGYRDSFYMCALGGLFKLSQRFFNCFYIEEELRELNGVVRGSKVVAEGQR